MRENRDSKMRDEKNAFRKSSMTSWREQRREYYLKEERKLVRQLVIALPKMIESDNRDTVNREIMKLIYLRYHDKLNDKIR